MARRRRYYDPGSQPMPRRAEESRTATQSHQVKETRQQRRKLEREARDAAAKRRLTQ